MGLCFGEVAQGMVDILVPDAVDVEFGAERDGVEFLLCPLVD